MYSSCCVSRVEASGLEYINIEIEQCRDAFIVSYPNKQFETTTPLQTLQNIIFENTVYKSGVMPLHAGAVEINGKAFIFVATTGTGKTTLIAYLSDKGYQYINDDKVFVDKDTLCVLPHISPIHLRPESIPVLGEYGCAIEGKEIITEKIRRIVYTPKNVVSRDVPIGGLFFLQRSESINKCESIGKSEATQMILRNLLQYSPNGKEIIKCAIKLAEKCRNLTYSDMGYVAGTIGKDKAVYG